MKRIITLFLSLTLLALSATMLYGCGDSETPPTPSSSTVSSTQGGTNNTQSNHTHTFETTWTQAENGHYRACTCHPEEKELAPHADSVDRDGKCDVCQFTMKAPTTFTFILKDENGQPVVGAEIRIYTNSSDKILKTDESGTVTHELIYFDSVKAIVCSVPEGYADISSQIFRFDGTTLEATAAKIPS